MGAQSLSGSVSAFCKSESETIQQSTMAESDQQIVDKVKAALDTAVGILNDKEGWKVEKEKDGATIKSKKNAEGRKVWLCEVVTKVSASKLWEKLQDTDSIASWNTTLTESRVLRHIGDVKLSYQMTAEGGAGLVSAARVRFETGSTSWQGAASTWPTSLRCLVECGPCMDLAVRLFRQKETAAGSLG